MNTEVILALLIWFFAGSALTLIAAFIAIVVLVIKAMPKPQAKGFHRDKNSGN